MESQDSCSTFSHDSAKSRQYVHREEEGDGTRGLCCEEEIGEVEEEKGSGEEEESEEKREEVGREEGEVLCRFR